CLQVDEIKDSYHWRSVIAYGTFEEVSNEETRENVLSKLYSRLPYMTPVESMLVEGGKETIVFRIKVEEVTGMAEEWGVRLLHELEAITHRRSERVAVGDGKVALAFWFAIRRYRSCCGLWLVYWGCFN